MEIDEIYNMDCLEGMKQIPDGSIDAIICDLPYGTMKGIGRGGNTTWANINTEWDEVIPSKPLFEQYERVLRRNGVAILFSQEPYTSHLRTFKASNFIFLYPLMWKKSHAGNAMMAKSAPMNYFEDMSVFVKPDDSTRIHSLREYSKKVCKFMGKTSKDVVEYFRTHDIATPTRAQHFLSHDGIQFALCTAETYGLLISEFHIDQMQGFRTFESLQAEDDEYKDRYRRVFNIPDWKACVSNVFEYDADPNGFHPTQKPVALIADLIRTYSNEGDTILDNCMGSGTTAVACIKEKRHFIGFELNKDYFDKACRRISAEKRQLTLF